MRPEMLGGFAFGGLRRYSCGMAQKPPFVSGSMSNSMMPPGYGPDQTPDGSPHDGAPAGRFFSDAELPVVAVPGGSATQLTGRPDMTSTEMMPSGDEPTMPPSGNRR